MPAKGGVDAAFIVRHVENELSEEIGKEQLRFEVWPGMGFRLAEETGGRGRRVGVQDEAKADHGK
jgi:hypothetical protein